MIFRKNDTTNECIDFVQFRLNNGETTQKYCGILSTSYSMAGQFQESTNKYRNWGMGAAKSKKEIEVIVFIAKEPLQEGETMDLKIAFTLYTGEGCCVIVVKLSRLLSIGEQSNFLLVYMIHLVQTWK